MIFSFFLVNLNSKLFNLLMRYEGSNDMLFSYFNKIVCYIEFYYKRIVVKVLKNFFVLFKVIILEKFKSVINILFFLFVIN